MIAIIDYGIGNKRSLINAFNYLGEKVIVEKDAKKIKNYEKLVLPGVGAFANAMNSLEKTNMKEALLEFVKTGKYIIGICLGMQILFDKSFEFKETKGLGLIKGEIIPFDKTKFKENLKIPHMAWNKEIILKEHKLHKGLKKEEFIYFVHSYHTKTEEKNIYAKTLYGYEFPSTVIKNNIIAMQGHPEKSHNTGLKILKNFIEL